MPIMTSHLCAASVLRTKPGACGYQLYESPLPSLSASNSASLFSKPSPRSVENGMLCGSAQTLSTLIRSTILQLRELQDRPDADQGRIDELTNRVEWDTRIFEERRKTMNFVCEVPVLIEQRLFALARAIQQSLE